MQEIIFIFLLYHILFRTQFNGTLSCGIFGGSGRINLRSITDLGIANDSRGGDGTGYYYGNNINKGIGTVSRFDALTTGEPIEYKPKSPTFIGHTRKATHGAQTAENTHPFLINDTLILAHNGQIFNIDELCKKYDIDNSKVSVDSKALAMLIEQEGFKVLDEYVGWAALAMSYTDEPDVIYLYHGASNEDNYNGTKLVYTEERPLFYLQTKDALYFSSIEHSLFKIRESKKEKVHNLPTNVVVKIKNGKFVAGAETLVSRRDTNKDLEKFRFPISYYNKTRNNVFRSNDVRTPPKIETPKLGMPSKLDGLSSVMDINGEAKPVLAGKERILYYHKGRHHTAISGQDYGILAQGVIYADKETGYYERYTFNGELAEIPATRTVDVDDTATILEAYFFHRGIMIHDKEMYFQLTNRLMVSGKDSLAVKLNATGNVALEMSHYSRYPVCLYESESFVTVEGFNRKIWWFRGQKATFGKQKPRFTNKLYNLLKGFLIEIIEPLSKEDKKPVIATPTDEEISKFANVEKNGKFNFGWDPEVHELAREAYVPVDTEAFLHEGIGDELDRALALYARAALKKTFDQDSKQLSAMIDDYVLQEILFRCYSQKVSIYEVLDPNLPSIEYFLDCVLKSDNDPTPFENVENDNDDDTLDIDTPKDNTTVGEYPDSSDVDNPFIEGVVMATVGEEYMQKRGDELSSFETSDFSQDLAKAFYQANDRLLADIKEIADKYNMKELVQQVIQTQKYT